MTNYRIRWDSVWRIKTIEKLDIDGDVLVYKDKLAKGANAYELKYF